MVVLYQPVGHGFEPVCRVVSIGHGFVARIGDGRAVAVLVVAVADGLAVAIGDAGEAVEGVIRIGRRAQSIGHAGAIAVVVVTERHRRAGGIGDFRPPIVGVVKVGGGFAVRVFPADEIADGVVAELRDTAIRVGGFDKRFRASKTFVVVWPLGSVLKRRLPTLS